nr:reverse transcriptase domain-containing protein [Tanacetum cinerariifolium]
MSHPDVAGRLQKWSIMLGEHNITYRPRTSIKGQILADFLNEIPDKASQGVPVEVTQEEPWTLFTDGSSCVDRSGAGLILTNLEGVEFTYALRFQFAASNNEAEYEALVAATTSLTGFSCETAWPLGQLRLLMTIGDATHSTKAWMNFMVVKSLSPYNGIIGRPGLKAIQAVPSKVHGMLKFPTEGGIVTICSSLLIHAECASIDTSSVTPREDRTRPTNFTVALHPNFPDQEVVESLCGYPFKCFLDAYKGYHQIQLAEADEEKTTFHTGHGVYCYTKMPFGLKNAGATYQRLMDKAFESQMGRNIEVYVDDLVVKSHTEAEMVRDIEETFRTLRKINMKLNPKKCSFGLAEGVFLGYVITPEGIKPCPDKTAAVLQLPSPQTVKEVQSLNGKLASLNRFSSKSAEKSLPLFQTLKKCIKKSDFRWTAEAEQASCLVPTWQDDCKSEALCWESITLHTD